jgi:arylsulfatase A-like enzyme
MRHKSFYPLLGGATAALILAASPTLTSRAQAPAPAPAQAQQKRPNIVMLMTDDTGWNDFGAYSGGGAALGHPTPNVDQIAKEGAVFTNWYGQASCTAGRASFLTGRLPIRSALSIVVAPGDENYLRAEHPDDRRILQEERLHDVFFRQMASGRQACGLSDRARLRRDERIRRLLCRRLFLQRHHEVLPSLVSVVQPAIQSNVRQRCEFGEWEGVAGQPATKVGTINYDSLATFDIRQTDSAIAYIGQHANSNQPFFMDVNFIKMHNPTNAAPEFRGKSHLGDYSDSLMELDADIGRIMAAIRAQAPNTIVIVTADNGAWLDAYPDAGTTPYRGEKGSPFEGGWRVPGIMWWPNHIPAGVQYGEMMSHIDSWATLATMVGLTPPPHDWVGNDGKPIYFDSIDNNAYILGTAPHSARNSWIYIDGETFQGARADIGGDPNQPWVHIAWKYLYTAKDSWLGAEANLGAIGALYNLTMDPYEKYDMIFNGAAPTRVLSTSPGKYSGEDNGWALSLLEPVIIDFDKSIMKYPNIKRFPGGASNDLVPDLQHPENPLPLLKDSPGMKVHGGGGG